MAINVNTLQFGLDAFDESGDAASRLAFLLLLQNAARSRTLRDARIREGESASVFPRYGRFRFYGGYDPAQADHALAQRAVVPVDVSSLIDGGVPEFRLPVDVLEREPQPRARDSNLELVARALHAGTLAATQWSSLKPELRSFFQGGRWEVASLIVRGALFDREPVVRIAAAAADVFMSTDTRLSTRLLQLFARDRSGGDTQILALAAQAAVRPGNGVFEVEGMGRHDVPPGQAPDTVIVHGTWSHHNDWWQPQAEFPRYLRDNLIFPHLYSGSHPFTWAGLFRREPRMDAAGALAWWCHRNLDRPPHLIGHSHGGTVAMLSTQLDLTVQRLLLLACPVTSVRPKLPRCMRVDSVRAPYDFVLWAAGYETRFPKDAGIREYVLRTIGPSIHVLRTHAAPRDPEVWRREKIATHLQLP